MAWKAHRSMRNKRKKLVALGYHSIWHPSNHVKLHGELYAHISLPTVFFEEHIRYLQEHGYTFLQFRDLVHMLSAGQSMPDNAVLIYFDDGYKDVLLNAYPLLKRCGVSASIFLTTDFIDKKSLPPWAGGYKPADLDIFLSWDEVRQMRDVFEVGSHGVTHRKFTKILPAEVSWELAVSRDIIEKHAEVHLLAVSYPHSAYDEDVQEAVKKAGYTFSVGNGRGYNFGPEYAFLKKIPIAPYDNVKRLSRKLKYFPIQERARIWSARLKKLFL